ncbi:hypothetical protein ACFLZQ_07655, partial [Thermodesulfobacteriota bacterium]
FSLLYLNANETTQAVNIDVKDFRGQVASYINNAITLSRTLNIHGISDFTLLTNNKSIINEYISEEHINVTLDVKEIPFALEMPSGADFYSAHYKIDAFRYFSTLDDGYYSLCDLDVACINNPPSTLNNLVRSRIPICYDVTDQVAPAFGQDTIIQELTQIARLESEGRWIGGEFIAGPPSFFKKLIKEIDDLFPYYVSNLSSFDLIGDEALTSAALERLRREGVYIDDAGKLGIISRYWGFNVLHPQKPFDYYKNCFLLHLPADKRFLSDSAYLGQKDLSNMSIIYERYLKSETKQEDLSNMSIIYERFLKSKTRRLLKKVKAYIKNLIK